MSSNRVIDLRRGRPAQHSPAQRKEAPRESNRRSPLRRRRRRTRLIIAFVLLLILATAVYGVHLASYVQRFTIQTVDVQGVQNIPPDLIRTFVESELDDGSYHFLSRKNIFLYPRAVIVAGIARNFPRVSSASASLASPLSNTLIVTVDERTPYAKWCSDDFDAAIATSTGQCYVMDSQGIVFAESGDSLSPGLNIVYTGGIASSSAPIGSTFAPGHIAGFAALIKMLGNAGFTTLGISIDNEQDFFVHLQQGFFIKASYGVDAAQLVRNLQLILSSDALTGKEDSIEYVDLRFGNRVYFKLKGETEVPAQ